MNRVTHRRAETAETPALTPEQAANLLKLRLALRLGNRALDALPLDSLMDLCALKLARFRVKGGVLVWSLTDAGAAMAAVLAAAALQPARRS
jgi:hypothetical protein